MARKTSRNRRRRRTTRRKRKVKMNMRRMYKNVFGADVTKDVLMPVAGGAVGFLAARYLGNMLAMRDMGTSNPNTGKLIAAAVGIPATFMLARQMPGGMVARNSGPIVLGMGLAVAESYLRDTPMLGGSGAAAQVLPPSPTPESMPSNGDGTAGLASYYDYPVDKAGQALSDYYTEGMLGDVDAVSTVIPTDLALRAKEMPQFAPVSERFVNQGNRGHAGGMFARHLFSGMTGA